MRFRKPSILESLKLFGDNKTLYWLIPSTGRLCNEYLQILLILCHAAPTPANLQKTSDFIESLLEWKTNLPENCRVSPTFFWGGDYGEIRPQNDGPWKRWLRTPFKYGPFFGIYLCYFCVGVVDRLYHPWLYRDYNQPLMRILWFNNQYKVILVGRVRLWLISISMSKGIHLSFSLPKNIIGNYDVWGQLSPKFGGNTFDTFRFKFNCIFLFLQGVSVYPDDYVSRNVTCLKTHFKDTGSVVGVNALTKIHF